MRRQYFHFEVKFRDFFLLRYFLMPPIFVITDRAVEDGRHICNALEGQLRNRGPICPRICTFGMGIGLVKNSYVLDLTIL